MHFFATTTPAQVLELGKLAAVVEVDKPERTTPRTGGRMRGPKSPVADPSKPAGNEISITQ